MTDEETDKPVDPEVRQFLLDAWTTEPSPGHQERVLVAIEAEAERMRLEAAAEVKAVVVPIRARRLWPVVAAAIVALAALAVLVVHRREQPQRMVTPGTEWTPGTASPVPPRHREQ